MRRRRFLQTGVAGLLLAATAGCHEGDKPDDRVVKLVASGHQGADEGPVREYWNDVAAAFHERHPEIVVDVRVVRPNDVDAEVDRMVRDDDLPDVAQLPTFAPFAAADRLTPARELLSLPVLGDFVPSVAAAGERQRVPYAIPFSAVTTRLYYNRELFRQAGLDDTAPPSDWTGLVATAHALRDAGVPVPLALPLSEGDACLEAAAWLLGGGGSLTDTNGVYTLDTAHNVETLRWLRDELVGPGLCGDPATTHRAAAHATFLAGEAGMVLGDTLLLRQLDEVGVDFATAEVPGRDGPAPATLGQATWTMGFTVRPALAEPIADLLSFVHATTAVPAIHERYDVLPVTDPAARTLRADDDPGTRRLRPFLDQLDAAVFPPAGKETWPSVARRFARSVREAVKPDSDVRRLLGDLQQEARRADRAADGV